MGINKIGDMPESDHEKSKKVPNVKKFQQELKIEKTPEVFDENKKNKYLKEDEEVQDNSVPSQPTEEKMYFPSTFSEDDTSSDYDFSSYQSGSYTSDIDEESLIQQNPDENDFYINRPSQKTSQDENKSDVSKKPSEAQPYNKPHPSNKTDSSKFSKKEEKFIFTPGKSNEESLKIVKEKKVHFTGDKKEIKTEKGKTTFPFMEPPTKKEKELLIKKEFKQKSDSEKKRDELIGTSLQIEIPKEVVLQASNITNTVAPFLDPKVLVLFERMVGTLMVMDKSGMVSTEVSLTSSEYKSSIFFGSKIVLEKYSTAPNSFNIRFIGNTESIALIDKNIGSLMQAFHKSEFSFKVGRISTEHETVEKPLFKRKEKTQNNNSKRENHR